jgi:hypothetical protein
VRVPDDPVQDGDVAAVGGSPGVGEAKPDPLMSKGTILRTPFPNG